VQPHSCQAGERRQPHSKKTLAIFLIITVAPSPRGDDRDAKRCELKDLFAKDFRPVFAKQCHDFRYKSVFWWPDREQHRHLAAKSQVLRSLTHVEPDRGLATAGLP
jgi:hypothetical protein